jgi:hypothetical protein
MLYTTFALAKKADACGSRGTPYTESYGKMADALGGIAKYGKDTLIPLTKVIEVCGLQDALWALRCTTTDSTVIRVTMDCDCAERVLPIYEKKYPGDMRVRHCIETTREYLVGKATKEEIEWAARSAEMAAWSAESAAGSAAWSAARSARSAAWSTWSAAWAVAMWAARSVEIEWQTKHFIELLEKDG